MGCISAFIYYSLCVFFILSLSLSVSEFECEWMCGVYAFKWRPEVLFLRFCPSCFLRQSGAHSIGDCLVWNSHLVWVYTPHTFGSQIPSPASTLLAHLSSNNVPSTLQNPQSQSCIRLHILPSVNNSPSTPGNNQTGNFLIFLCLFSFFDEGWVGVVTNFK